MLNSILSSHPCIKVLFCIGGADYNISFFWWKSCKKLFGKSEDSFSEQQFLPQKYAFVKNYFSAFDIIDFAIKPHQKY